MEISNEKVGILTYQHTTNFGSLLQTYALYKKVTDLGVQCEIINYRNDTIDKREQGKALSDSRTLKDVFRYFFRERGKRIKSRRFRRFLKERLSLGEECYSRESIKSASGKYDVFLVGSDLVWDFSINSHDTAYMLDFVGDSSKKIAYAASAGAIWDEREEVTRLLSGFKHIGVRELEIKDTLEEWLDREIDFVCDPTMLIEPDFWRSMASKRMINEEYIVCYFHDKENLIYKEALEYGKRHNLPVYVVTVAKAPAGCKAVRPSDVYEFLSVIRYADTVFTASYHGMLFSLYFEKNLYYYNRGWRSRMESVAKLLGIEDREHLTDKNENSKIDYGHVNREIKRFRDASVEKLHSYLSD